MQRETLCLDHIHTSLLFPKLIVITIQVSIAVPFTDLIINLMITLLWFVVHPFDTVYSALPYILLINYFSPLFFAVDGKTMLIFMVISSVFILT